MDTRILDALDKELQVSEKRLAPKIKELAKAVSAERKRIERQLGTTPTEWSDPKKTGFHATGQGRIMSHAVRELALSRLWGELVFSDLYSMKEPKK